MKQQYTLLFMLLVTLQIFGQTSLNWGFATGSQKSDNVGGAITDNDGNILSVLYGKDQVDVDPSNATHIIAGLNPGLAMLNKYDRNGQYLWTRQFIDSIGVGIRPLYVYPNNDILIAVSFTKKLYLSDAISQEQIADVNAAAFSFILMNEDGAIDWIKTYPSSGKVFINDVISLEDGGLLFGGSFNGDITLNNANVSNSGKSDAIIGVIDNSGNIANYKTFGGTDDDYVTNLSLRSNNEVSFGILTDSILNIEVKNIVQSFNNTKKSAFIFGHMNYNLEVQFAQSIEATGGAEVDNFTLDEDHNYYICGYFQGDIQFDPSNSPIHNYGSLADSDAFIVKYDQNGNIIWSKVYPSNSYAGINKLKIYNNYLYTAGYFDTDIDLEPGNENLYFAHKNGLLLLKLDKDGKLIWHNAFFSDDVCGIVDFDFNDEKDITCYGFFYANLDIDPGNNDFILSPQPADAFLFSLRETHTTKIDYNSNNEKNYELIQTISNINIRAASEIEWLQLFDSSGKMLYAINNGNSSHIEISTQNYLSGLYALKLEVDGIKSSETVLVIR